MCRVYPSSPSLSRVSFSPLSAVYTCRVHTAHLSKCRIARSLVPEWRMLNFCWCRNRSDTGKRRLTPEQECSGAECWCLAEVGRVRRGHPHVTGRNHRVGRVLGLFSTRRNRDSPILSAAGESAPDPLIRGECAPPPFGLRGGAHSLGGEGLGESQFRRRDIHCVALFI